MHYEDRICRLYNELIPVIIPDYPKRSGNLINVEMTTGYSTLHIHYVFNSIPSIKVGGSLHCQVLFTIDKFLNWCDLTEFGDNKFMIHLHSISNNTIEKVSYFELFDVAMSHWPHSYKDHPKLSQFFQWKEEWRKYQGEYLRLKQIELDNLDRIRQSQILLRDL
jgi:hypothetical protein